MHVHVCARKDEKERGGVKEKGGKGQGAWGKGNLLERFFVFLVAWVTTMACRIPCDLPRP